MTDETQASESVETPAVAEEVAPDSEPAQVAEQAEELE